MKSFLGDYLKGLSQLFFPNVCVNCQRGLAKNETVLCLVCEVKLPKTNFHQIAENPIEKRLWGRLSVERASSFLFFEKGSQTQHLMKLLKYQNRQDVGEKLGKLYAQNLARENALLCRIDAIIPLPLHPEKQKHRGYNQCDSIAKAMGEVWQKPVFKNAVARTTNNITQTGKNRMSRWENVERIFEVKEPEKLKNKHILLVDDVITTGATLEACGMEILEVEGTKLSIATLACAM